MKEYPVGSIVTIVYSDNFKHLIGTDATITGGLDLYGNDEGDVWLGYELDITYDEYNLFNPPHDYVRLKKFPPDLDRFCNETMLKVLKPVEIKDEEIVK